MHCYPKLNIFLKITGRRSDGYHLLSSRFILFKGISDLLEIVPRTTDDLIINCDILDNILEKSIKILCQNGFTAPLNDLFKTHQISLLKNIPSGAGLGGASSDAAGLLRLLNECLNLKINTPDLMKIAAQIGADVPFFVSGFEAANVSGIGDEIAPFDDDIPPLSLVPSRAHASTPAVYRAFDEMASGDFFAHSTQLAAQLAPLTTERILSTYPAQSLNDLLLPCQSVCGTTLKDGEFLSGSGSWGFKPILS